MIYLVCIFGYLGLLGGIAIYKARQVKNQSDFAVAGRSLSPWVMVCTMLAVWIGTGSIVGNAEQTYETGVAALLLPIGTFVGMILLSFIARRARGIEANTVPDIINRRFGHTARNLTMVALVLAYMVIVSYQFNAGGAVLEVIAGTKPPVEVGVGTELEREHLTKGRVIYTPEKGWVGETEMIVETAGGGGAAAMTLKLIVGEKGPGRKPVPSKSGEIPVKADSFVRLRVDPGVLEHDRYIVRTLPEHGSLELVEPILTARTATLIAAAFIIIYASMAGLLSLAAMDIVTGTIIMLTMVIALPVFWVKAGGWSGIEAGFMAAGAGEHMNLWGRYSATTMINYILPVFLLVLGDANQYQRIFASRSVRGARTAVIIMIFTAYAVELLIIACAWVASSMTPDPENGKYILLFAAANYLALPLGCLFMVTVVAIIISTADSFLHVPATSFVNDLYLHYINPKASQKRIVWMSRIMVVVFGITAYIVTFLFSETTGFFQKALYAFTIYGSAITPSLVAAIVWKRATRAGAISSIAAGTIVTLVWGEAAFIQDALPPAISGLDAVLPAIIASVACLIFVSLLTKPQPSSASLEGKTPEQTEKEQS